MDFDDDDDDDTTNVSDAYPLSGQEPPRVVTAYGVVHRFECRSELTKEEVAAYKAALRVLTNYLNGENSYS